VNSRVKKVPPSTYFLMGFRFSVRNGLYVGGAVVLLMAMALLTAIHMYTAINPPTIVLAIQPGGNKPQTTLWYRCRWTWGLPGMPLSSAPAGSNVPFSGSYTYAWSGVFLIQYISSRFTYMTHSGHQPTQHHMAYLIYLGVQGIRK